MCSTDNLRLVPTIYQPSLAGVRRGAAARRSSPAATAWASESSFEGPTGTVAATLAAPAASRRVRAALPRLSTALWAACVAVPVGAATLLPVAGLLVGYSLVSAGVLAGGAVAAIALLTLATALADAWESRMPHHPRLDTLLPEQAS
jgi:hypothetical protein